MDTMYSKVREFTRASCEVSKCPRKITRDELHLVVNLIIEETDELCEACGVSFDEIWELMSNARRQVKRIKTTLPTSDEEMIAEQQDALVDLIYVVMNAAAKTGVDIDPVFDVVHKTNMAKIDPVTGKVNKRADGKVIKPPGWQPPDILSEIKRQISEQG